MIRPSEDALVIEIRNPDPALWRSYLMHSLAAALRWHALSQETYIHDGHHAAVLSELLGELIDTGEEYRP